MDAETGVWLPSSCRDFWSSIQKIRFSARTQAIKDGLSDEQFSSEKLGLVIRDDR